jgi:predicted cobalt transporter CbtA
MVGKLLLRGMLAGLIAGALAVAFAKIASEPQVSRAEAFERQEIMQRGELPEPELVPRAIQDTAGLATGVGVYSIALGGLFALVFAVAYGRIGRLGPRETSALIALGGFLAVGFLPFLKYPPNPPSVGNPATIDQRTALYFAMILLVAVGVFVWWRLSKLFAPNLGAWNATLAAGGIFLVYVVVLIVAMPQINEVPAGFPATVLWNFRLASLGVQAILWTTLGLLFGMFAERYLRGGNQSPA